MRVCFEDEDFVALVIDEQQLVSLTLVVAQAALSLEQALDSPAWTAAAKPTITRDRISFFIAFFLSLSLDNFQVTF
jgi:hypothetical protein